jgi:glycosyltransferase involved in cell wall biosynthesis
MNILHYSLGLPPERSGGLTKYSTDLLLQQISSGENVTLLFPENCLVSRKTRAIEFKGLRNGLKSYAFQNSSPIPLLEGIKNPETIFNYTLSKKDINSFHNFIEKADPDIFHIHTLMGLPLEFVEILKAKHIKIIYTSHDYFGLCLKVNFIDSSGNLCTKPSGSNCALCNLKSPSETYLRIRNSNIVLKNKRIIRSILNLKNKILSNNAKYTTKTNLLEANISIFQNTINYHKKIYLLVDCFHFNSSVARDVFEKHLGKIKHKIIPITHSNITDNRKVRKINNSKIRIGFIGNTTSYKGLPLLQKALKFLWENGIQNWQLNIWGNDSIPEYHFPTFFNKGKYDPSQISMVFDEMDLLIVPSIWKETFSLVTLEGISFGIPVVVTTNVGAKDIVSQYNPDFIIEPNYNSFIKSLEQILMCPEILVEFNNKILDNSFKYDMQTHNKAIVNTLYQKN